MSAPSVARTGRGRISLSGHVRIFNKSIRIGSLSMTKQRAFFAALACSFCMCSSTLFAQGASEPPADPAAKIATLESSVKAAQSAGDNAWMLVASALVLMMTGPGLALFYGGLVRRKNVLATMMQSFVLMAVVTVLWAFVGYSMAFGGSGPFVGNMDFFMLNGVGSAPNTDYAGTIP